MPCSSSNHPRSCDLPFRGRPSRSRDVPQRRAFRLQRLAAAALLAAGLLTRVSTAAHEAPVRAPGHAGDGRALHAGGGACHEAFVATNGARAWLVAWSRRDTRHGRIEVAALRDGARTAAPLPVSDPAPGTIDVRPVLSWLSADTALCVWQRNTPSTQYIVGRLLRADGSALGREFVLSDTSAGTRSTSPAATASGPGTALIAWNDTRRRPDGTVRSGIAACTVSGAVAGTPVLVSSDPTTSTAERSAPVEHPLAGAPCLAAAPRGMGTSPHPGGQQPALLVWTDNRSGTWAVHARMLDASETGIESGPVALIDRAQPKDMTLLVHAAWIDTVRAVVAWKDYREGNSNIYLRVVSRDSGSPATGPGSHPPALRGTAPVRVNTDPGEQWQRLPWTAVTADAVLVCWEDYRETTGNQRGDVYIRRLALRGLEEAERTGARARVTDTRVNEGTGRAKRKQPRMAAGGGRVLVAWSSDGGPGLGISARWLRTSGAPDGREFIIARTAAERP